jgi:hypothetical protein
LYWDARFLMSYMPSNGRPLEEEVLFLYITHKVNVNLYLIKHHAMKTYGGVET